MAGFTPPAYPEILTAKSFSKNEGIIAKLVGKSGLPELLAACEKAYGSIRWDPFDLPAQLKREADPNQKTLDALEAEANKAIAGAKGLESALAKLEKQALVAQKDFKADKIIPADSTAHVGRVAAAAKSFSSEVSAGALGKLLKEQVTAGAAYVAKAKAEKIANFKDMHKALDACDGKIGSIKTREEAQKFWEGPLSQVARQFGNLFHIIPDLKSDHKAWLRYGSQKARPTTDEAVKPALANLAPLLKTIRKKLEAAEKG